MKRLNTMKATPSDMTREDLEVQGWLRRQSHGILRIYAIQFKIPVSANKSDHQIIEELRMIPEVQQLALERIRGEN